MTSRRKFLKKTALSGIGILPLSLSAVPNSENAKLPVTDFAGSDSDYWKMIRSQFSLKSGQTYFNNGTIGAMPDYTINRMIDNLRFNAINGAETDYVDQGPQLLTGYFKYENLRKKVGAIINASFEEIALVQNATFGMNYVANGMDLKKGDEIINTDQEHGGGYAAWRLLAKRKGCGYKQVAMPVPANDPQVIIDAIIGSITSKTKVIAIPHIVSVYGVVMPVKEICAEARKRGIFTIIDGAQTVGQIKVDVQDIGCDAYYSSLHKWLLAPAGSGVLYIRKENMPKIWSTIASYNWENEEDHGFRLMQNGTGNTALIAGFEASIDFFNTVGSDRWISRIKFLGDRLRTGLIENSKVMISSSIHPEMCAGMTTYGIEGMEGAELQKVLWEKERLQPRSVGKPGVRHSVHIYNNEEEIDRTLTVLSSL